MIDLQLSKKTYKGSFLVVWNEHDYLSVSRKELSDKMLNGIWEKIVAKYLRSNPPGVFLGKGVLKIYSKFWGEHGSFWCFQTLKEKNQYRKGKRFLCNYKNATDLGKLCFLPKIHRRLSNILGWLIIYNIKIPTENLQF